MIDVIPACVEPLLLNVLSCFSHLYSHTVISITAGRETLRAEKSEDYEGARFFNRSPNAQVTEHDCSSERP